MLRPKRKATRTRRAHHPNVDASVVGGPAPVEDIAASVPAKTPHHPSRAGSISLRNPVINLTPSQNAICDRIMNLFTDPSMIMRFTFELDPEVCGRLTDSVSQRGTRLATPFHRQGDESSRLPHEKERRYRLLNNKKVVDMIDRFWNVFTYKDVQYGVNREQYIAFHLLLSKTLRSDSLDNAQ